MTQRDPVADLEEALSMLRSAGAIAARDGAHTNWPAFREGVRKALLAFNMRPVSPRSYRLVTDDRNEPSGN